MSTFLLRLRGLLACLAILAFAVGTPFLLVRIDGVPSFGQFTWDSLMAPDDGTFALEIIKALAWLLWGIFAFSVVLAIPAEIRGIQAPRIPGLALPQGAARQLVASAALVFTSIPTSHLTAATQPAQPAPITLVDKLTAPEPAQQQPPKPDATSNPNRSTSTQESSGAPTKLHTVQRGESLWKIAEKYLGEGQRYAEIRDLNPAVLGDDLDFLEAGVILRVPDMPVKTPASDEETYIVQPGDTLSEIAAEQLGDSHAYAEIARASSGTRQPDGAHLTDPDLIRPGWRLTLPADDPVDRHTSGNTRSAPANGSRPEPVPNPAVTPTPSPPPTPPAPAPDTPSPTITDKAQAESSPAHAQDSDDGPSSDDSVTPAWVLPGLTGAGALLAASLLVILHQRRRTQLRHRRPGHMIARAATELIPVAKTLRLAEEPGLRRIDGLDRLLRTLPADDPPPLMTAEIGADDTLNLHLAEPATLEAPWQGDGREWSAPLDAVVDVDDRCAAYPLLVTLGEDDEGRHWLLNLEQAQGVTITGDPDRAHAYLRFMTAELAANRWSTRACVDALGIGAELATLDPDRLRHHPDDDTAFLDWVTADLAPTAEEDELCPDQHHVVATTSRHRDAAESVLKLISQRRTGAAVVMISSDDSGPMTTGVVLAVSASGRISVPELGLTLNAVGLTSEEATISAGLVDATRAAINVEVPDHEHPANEIDDLTDRAGSIRRDLVEPRPDDAGQPAGRDSILQDAGTTYDAAAATTDEDVRALAPVVPAGASEAILNSDPDLDKDLAAYVDPDSRNPKLTLLGPLNARCYGQPLVNRKPFFTELLAYLVLHPDGVTSDRAAEAFHTRPERIHTEMGILRNWLGDIPGSEEKYLPKATKSTRPADSGKGIYQVRGILCDLDLFRRLRARAEARGADGIEDLIAAFDLVSGEPFSEGRSNGWSWIEDDLTETIARCAVVDVAHVLITHALAVKDHALAWRVAEKVVAIVPADDTARLDAIQVAAATGHANLAVQQLIDEIYNRSDDDLGPIELPERATEIIERHHLDKLARAARRESG